MYGIISNQYKYEMQKHPLDWERWPRDGNIGDCIQSLAIKNLYKELGINNYRRINRDDISEYNEETCILPMQSWFGNYAGVFPLPWTDNIRPVFIGFHLNKINKTRERFICDGIDRKMAAFLPIGCRDRNTRDFLCSLGLDAYFSGCMTLSFPKREKQPKKGKIFLVDLTPAALNVVPKFIKDKADKSISHFYYFHEYPVTKEGAEEFEAEAAKILKRYKDEAKLVITSKIHCAMPCAAMGIPVIFLHEDFGNERFDVLKGIVPAYNPLEDKNIDWNPAISDFEKLKKAIKKNAFYQITKYENANFNKDEEQRLINELNVCFDEYYKKSTITLKFADNSCRISYFCYLRYKLLSVLMPVSKKRKKYRQKCRDFKMQKFNRV